MPPHALVLFCEFPAVFLTFSVEEVFEVLPDNDRTDSVHNRLKPSASTQTFLAMWVNHFQILKSFHCIDHGLKIQNFGDGVFKNIPGLGFAIVIDTTVDQVTTA